MTLTIIIICAITLVLMLLTMWLNRRADAELARRRIEFSGEDSTWHRDGGAGLTAPIVPRSGSSEDEEESESEPEPELEPEPEPEQEQEQEPDESEPDWKNEPDFEVELATPPGLRPRDITQSEPQEPVARRDEVEQSEAIQSEPQVNVKQAWPSEPPRLQPEPQPLPEPEPQPESEREAQALPDFEAEIARQPDPHPDPEVDVNARSRAFQPEPLPQPPREPEPVAEAEPEAELELEPEAEAEPEPEPIVTQPIPRVEEPPLRVAHAASDESRAEPQGGRDVVESPKLAPPAPSTVPTGPHLHAGNESAEPRLLDEVVSGLEKIPPLPQSAFQIIKELESAVASAKIVGDILSSDPLIGAALVGVVNSAALGVARRIPTVHEAVSYLGFSTVRGVILRLKLASLFPPPKARKNCYDTSALWVHATAVSAVADVLAKRVGQNPELRIDPALASTLGLLHDVGKLAINSQFPVKVAELSPRKKAKKPAGTPAAAYENMLARERRIFGADHAFIGGHLAQRWQLHEDLADAIRLHHLPADQTLGRLPPPVRRAVFLVHIANQLVKLKHSYCEDMPFDVIPESLLTALNLPPSLDELLDQPVCAAIAQATAISHELDVAVPKPRKRLSA